MINIRDDDAFIEFYDLVSTRANAIAKQKKWWPYSDVDNRPFVGALLLHEEIAEATRAWRKRDTLHRWEDGKPEGFPFELADIAIRTAGLIYAEKWAVPSYVKDYTNVAREQDVLEQLWIMHRLVDDMSLHFTGWRLDADRIAWPLLYVCYDLAEELDINLVELCNIKQDYNMGRPPGGI